MYKYNKAKDKQFLRDQAVQVLLLELNQIGAFDISKMTERELFFEVKQKLMDFLESG